jgi:hypothetical protein
MTEYERPNTVSGLVAKHKELRKLREQYRKEVKKLTISISHIEACIRLFDPKANTSAMKERVTKPRTKRGSVKRFVLSTLREAAAPMTSHEITERWAEDCGLQADGEALAEIQKRISVCIANCAKQGLIECDRQGGAYSPYKLWKLKEGGA